MKSKLMWLTIIFFALAFVLLPRSTDFFKKIKTHLAGTSPEENAMRDCFFPLYNFDFHHQPQHPNPSIIFIGDSQIRLGEWQKLLAKDDILNLGISGDRSKCLIDRLQYVTGKKAKIWFVQIGINDFPDENPSTIFEHYKKIIAFIKNEQAIPVINLVFQISPKIANFSVSKRNHQAINKQVSTLNQTLEQYAQAQGIDYIDMNVIFAKNGVLQEQFTHDGLHLNEAAYAAWANAINIILKKYNI